MTTRRVALPLVALCTLGAAAATAIDLLQGADRRWAVAANLLKIPLAATIAVWAWHTAGRPVRTLTALGILVGPAGAALGDHAGATWWWLALEAAWWIGVTRVAWPRRPGLAVISALAAVSALVATAVTGPRVAEPTAASAGVPVAVSIAWLAWAGLDLASQRAGGLPRCQPDRQRRRFPAAGG